MKKRLSIFFVALTLVTAPLARLGQAQTSANDARTAKIKEQVARRMAEKKTRVKINLRDGTELKGTIDKTDDQRFTVSEDKTGKRVEVAYTDVVKIEGRGMGTGTKIGLVAAVTAGVLVVIAAIAVHNFRKNCCF